MELEIRRLRDNLEGRGRENEDLRNKINNLTGKLQELSIRSENKLDLERKVADYEAKIVTFTQEIERLNRVLRDKTNESNELVTRLRSFESESSRYTV